MRGSVLRDCLGDWFQSVVLHNKPPDICVGQYYATALEIVTVSMPVSYPRNNLESTFSRGN